MTLELDENEKLAADQLRKLGLVRKLMPKDGACLFRAISEHLHGTQMLHTRLRQLCVSYMRVNRDQFAPFISDDGEEGTSDYESYLDELEKVLK